MSTYTTVQGDTWDGVAFKLFGNHGSMLALMEANQPLIDWMIFPNGVVLAIPEIPEPVNDKLPFWRR